MSKLLRPLQSFVFIAIFTSLFLLPQVVGASGCTDFQCPGCKDTKVDFTCQRERLLNPSANCKLVYCADSTNTPPTQQTRTVNVNFFGVNMSIDEDKQVATFIYIIFSFFFGFVALALTLLGVYGAFLRSKAESPDDEAKAAKLLTNAIVGLILIVLSLVIAQLIASALGIGSLDKLVDFSGVFGGS
jgi:hypothetical protein